MSHKDKVDIKIFTNKDVEVRMATGRATEYASGFDIRACLFNILEFVTINKELGLDKFFKVCYNNSSIEVFPSGRVLIPTKMFVEIPPTYELQIRPRSGLAIKNGITVLNSPGTIDADYRGEIRVILINTDPLNSFIVSHGDRIGQGVLSKVYFPNFIEVDTYEELSDTVRGEGGFGHSGVK